MNNKEIFDRLLQCADSEIKNWRKADKITPLEQEVRYQPVIAGIARAALYLLPTDDYYRFKEEIIKKGGHI